MQRRHFVQIALSVAGSALLAGCGGGSGNSGGTTAGDGYGRGAVTGVVFVNSVGVLTLGDPAAPPAGASLAKGAHLEVVGEGITASAGADASFHLTNVRAGVRTLRITLGSTTKDVPLTVIANATISLKPTPVSRDQAIAAARASLSIPVSALVCAPQQPLPSGVVLTSAENTVQGATSGTTLPTMQWFLFVDTKPSNPFGHPTQFVLVDAHTGAVTSQNQEFWPVLNGCQHYAIAAYAPATADIVQAGPAIAASLKSLSSAPARPTGRSRAADTGQTRATIAAGWPRYDMLADTIHVPTLLGTGGIPTGTPTILLVPNAAKTHLLSVWNDACQQATEGDTVLFYLSSHGAKEGYALLATHFIAPPGTAAGDIFYTQDDGTQLLTEHLVPSDLLPALQTCLACEVIVMIDTCYSGVWANYFATVNLPRKAMPVTVLTSADADHISIGYPLQPAHVTDPPPPGAGAAYTNAFLAAFSQLAAGGGTVNLAQAHSQAAAALVGNANPDVHAQNPQIASYVPPSGMPCGVTLTPPTANDNPKDLKTVDFTVNVDGVVPADGAYTYNFATTGNQGTLVSATDGSGKTISSKHAIVGYLANSSASSGTTDDITVTVYTTEKTPRLVGSAKAVVTLGAVASTTETAGTLIFTKDYGNGTITVFAFYTFAPSASANEYVLSGAFAGGTLSQADYLKGAPVIDMGRTTGISTFIPYGATNFYNLGGLIGFQQYPGGTPGTFRYPASNEPRQHDGAVEAVSAPATITIT
jgi:hypothetical protein